jgi:hypothetical protein
LEGLNWGHGAKAMGQRFAAMNTETKAISFIQRERCLLAFQ